METTEIALTVKSIIQTVMQQQGKQLKTIEDQHDLAKDFGLNSLDIATIIAHLELKLQVDPFTQAKLSLRNINTVLDLATIYYDALLQQSPFQDTEIKELPQASISQQHAWRALSYNQIIYWVARKRHLPTIGARFIIAGKIDIALLKTAALQAVKLQASLYTTISKFYPLCRQENSENNIDFKINSQDEFNEMLKLTFLDYTLPLIKFRLHLHTDHSELQIFTPHIIADLYSLHIIFLLIERNYRNKNLTHQPIDLSTTSNLENTDSMNSAIKNNFTAAIFQSYSSQEVISLPARTTTDSILGESYFLPNINELSKNYSIPTDTIYLGILSLVLSVMLQQKSINLVTINANRNEQNALKIASTERFDIINIAINTQLSVKKYLLSIQKLQSNAAAKESGHTQIDSALQLLQITRPNRIIKFLLVIFSKLLSGVSRLTFLKKYYSRHELYFYYFLFSIYQYKYLSDKCSLFLSRLGFRRKINILMAFNYASIFMPDSAFDSKFIVTDIEKSFNQLTIESTGVMFVLRKNDGNYSYRLIGKLFDDTFRNKFDHLYITLLSRLQKNMDEPLQSLINIEAMDEITTG